MAVSFPERLENADGLADIFEIVKEAVWQTMRQGRAGLTLGLADFGGRQDYVIGAFYPVGSNIIVMNKSPLTAIYDTPLFKPYSFHILLHEYLHALGNLDERYTRELTRMVTAEVMGDAHVATQMSADMARFLPRLYYPEVGWQPEGGFNIELVPGFDRSSINYIA